MQNVTYLFGAGASYASMPLLEAMGKRLKMFRNWVYHKKLDDQFQRDSDFNESATQEFINELDDLIYNIGESTSIDNYANTLFNAGGPRNLQKLANLKFLLSIYFIFEQLNKDGEIFRTVEIDTSISSIPAIYKRYDAEDERAIKKQYDPRYRTFFNHFFDQKIRRFPHQLNIISWNNDLQIEGSYCRDFSCSLEDAQAQLNIFPSDLFALDDQISKIVKLNGTAGVLLAANNLYRNYISDFNINILVYLREAIRRFAMNKTTWAFDQGIRFAFEDRAMVGRTISEAKKIMAKTDILVIIGYSFPSMNRAIDAFLLKDTPLIKRVFLQIPANDQARVRKNLKAANGLLEGKIEMEDDLGEFFIPPGIFP